MVETKLAGVSNDHAAVIVAPQAQNDSHRPVPVSIHATPGQL
jgi:hypothetical protein